MKQTPAITLKFKPIDLEKVSATAKWKEVEGTPETVEMRSILPNRKRLKVLEGAKREIKELQARAIKSPQLEQDTLKQRLKGAVEIQRVVKRAAVEDAALLSKGLDMLADDESRKLKGGEPEDMAKEAVDLLSMIQEAAEGSTEQAVEMQDTIREEEKDEISKVTKKKATPKPKNQRERDIERRRARKEQQRIEKEEAYQGTILQGLQWEKEKLEQKMTRTVSQADNSVRKLMKVRAFVVKQQERSKTREVEDSFWKKEERKWKELEIMSGFGEDSSKPALDLGRDLEAMNKVEKSHSNPMLEKLEQALFTEGPREKSRIRYRKTSPSIVRKVAARTSADVEVVTKEKSKGLRGLGLFGGR